MQDPAWSDSRERVVPDLRIGDQMSGPATPNPGDSTPPIGSPVAGGVGLATGSSLGGGIGGGGLGSSVNQGSYAGSAMPGLHDPAGSSIAGSAAGGSSAPVGGAAVARPARATFDAGELAVVCSHFDIGVIESVREFRRGSGRAPKALIRTDRGRFLLKRRSLGSHGTERVAYTHALQQHLAARRYPLPQLIKTRVHHATYYVRDHHIYELFEFIPGEGYDGSLDATADAGRALAYFHRLLGNFIYRDYQPAWGTYHSTKGLVAHLDKIDKKLADPVATELIGRLQRAYDAAAAKVDDLSYAIWPQQTIHGDWHPGNMLFRNARVVAVIDYDTARLAPRIIDIANGALQFSITMQHGVEPERWPVGIDEGRFKRFCRGYETVPDQVISTAELEAIPHLMIEALIVEAAVPIANTGSFAGISALSFLKMVDAKAAWIASHAERLTALVGE